MENPGKPLYGGGIVLNPELNVGLEGWRAFGDAKVQHRELGGNKFVAAYCRNQSKDSISQEFYLQNEMLYSFSGAQFYNIQLHCRPI